MPPFSRGFHRRHAIDPEEADRVPPGQHVVGDFPVLSYGPTPHTPLDQWSFQITGAMGEPMIWSWEEFRALPTDTITRDIHCVTSWSKLGTSWTGVSVDTLLEGVDTDGADAGAWWGGDYPTHLQLEDLTGGKAWVVHTFEGQPLDPEHGGPARLLVPHLYFGKSAKWVRGLALTIDNEPGFWETAGYHDRGDPWQEQRYWND